MKYRLGDICTITKGETGIMKAIPGAYTMVALGEANKTHTEYQFDAKAVIIPLVSSTGHGHASMKRVKYQEGKFALGNILCAVIPKDENFVLAKYLHIYLHWNREELLVSQMKGMANVSLPMNRIADVEVIVPSIEKQKQIVELEAKLVEKELEADKLFADQLTQLENLNQAILQEAVQGKLVAQNPADEPASQLLKRIKAEKEKSGKKEKLLPPIKPEEIPFQIPESWVWCRLGDFAYNVEYGTSQKAEMSSAHIPVLRMNNIQSGQIDYENLKYVSSSIDDLPRLFLKHGDLLFNRTNSYELVGKTAVYDGADNKMTFASYLIRVQFEGLVVPKFISNYINSPICRKTQLEPDIIQQNGQANFNGTKLKNILVPLPPLSEQTRIVAEIENQLAKTKQLKEHIIANQQATEQLLKALLHEAFEVSEAKDAKSEEKEAKVIECKSLQEKEENYFVKRKVLATYIVNQSLDDNQFGDVKFEKLLHLSDYFAIKRNLGQKYYQKVAGPLDNAFTNQFFLQIEKGKWFNRKRIGRQYFFSAGENHSKSLKTYGYFSEEELNRVNKIIAYFKKCDYEQPEIISTLYAVWNNRLITGQEISNQELINNFYVWDDAKHKYPEDRLLKAIQWMKDENFVPDGWGNYIDKPKTTKS